MTQGLGTRPSGDDPTPTSALAAAFQLACLKRSQHRATPRWRKRRRRRLHADLIAACILADARMQELGAPWNAMRLIDVLDMVETGALAELEATHA